MKKYLVIDTKRGCPLCRDLAAGRRMAVVDEAEVEHDEMGLVRLIDILAVMGYQIEDHAYAVMQKEGVMGRESRFRLDELNLFCLDSETGLIS